MHTMHSLQPPLALLDPALHTTHLHTPPHSAPTPESLINLLHTPSCTRTPKPFPQACCDPLPHHSLCPYHNHIHTHCAYSCPHGPPHQHALNTCQLRPQPHISGDVIPRVYVTVDGKMLATIIAVLCKDPQLNSNQLVKRFRQCIPM